MSRKVEVLPPSIFCPRCGDTIIIKEDASEETKLELKRVGFTKCGVGVCRCGVVCVLLARPLPDSPTFVLQFDLYKTRLEEVKNLA